MLVMIRLCGRLSKLYKIHGPFWLPLHMNVGTSFMENDVELLVRSCVQVLYQLFMDFFMKPFRHVGQAVVVGTRMVVKTAEGVHPVKAVGKSEFVAV